MKKILLVVAMAVAATSTFAQGDALKALLKAKTYSEAKSILNGGLASMTNDQKAKAYNKMVQLSMEKIHKEEAIISGNQVAQQLKQDKIEPYDTVGYCNAIYTALRDAIECDKYDNMPNAKGKVAPKFHKANQEALWGLRTNLINAGQDASRLNNQNEAYKFFSMYVESSTAPLFADRDKSKGVDQYVGEVARVSAVIAFQNKDMETANKYCDVALKDTASYKDALNLKMYLMQQGLKTREDSVKCVQQFETLYANDKSETIFSNYASMLGNLGMKDKQSQVISEKLAENPNCFSAYAIMGQTEMNDSQWDAAVEDFKKAIQADPKKPLIYTFLGYCLNQKAAGLGTLAEQKKVLEESVKYLEKARELDPDRSEAKWGYPLYQCYYTLYGENDSRTKEVKALCE